MKWMALLLTWSTFATAQQLPEPPHLDLEASSQELLQVLATQNHFQIFGERPRARSPELDLILDAGQRNLDWLRHINSFRKDPLQFTKPGDLRGIPITKPKLYSETIVHQDFLKLQERMMPLMKEVLLQKKDYTQNPPEPLELYIELGRKMDVVYQTALRWIMMEPYLPWMKTRRQRDIRGYYFLSRLPNLEATLSGFDSLPSEEKKQIEAWLSMICYNTEEDDQICNSLVQSSTQNKTLVALYRRYESGAASIYDDFFQLQNPRRELTWAPNNEAKIDIFNNQSREQTDFLKKNLEDEWRWQNWRLTIGFNPNAMVKVHWQPGITPHVDGLGGGNVYMDSQAPLTEWDVQWTIRHEFGHVFGLPDCYIEFYSEPEQAMVTYQIDIDDLMCSRAGKINQRLYDEMKRAYQR
ncbi:MAG: hypothetical protein AB7N80_04505 [Bdellovibrionales bacterium]